MRKGRQTEREREGEREREENKIYGIVNYCKSYYIVYTYIYLLYIHIHIHVECTDITDYY